jgi:hypothetical protein
VKTTIEINGQKYDAKTGKVLRHGTVAPTASTKANAPKLKQPISNGKTIDGITRNSNNQNLQPSRVATVLAKPQALAHKISQVRLPAQPVHRTVEKSRTLIRSVVKKPLSIAGIHSTSSFIGNQSSTPTAVNNRRPLPPPAHTATINAKHIAMSPTISHFGTMTKNGFTKVVSSMGVATPPSSLEASPPLVFTKHGRGKHEKPQVFNHHIPKNNYQTSAKSASEKTAKRLSRRIKIKPKMAAICVTILAVFCLGGFLAYQNVPSVAMRVAAKSAGFNGRLPDDIPAGYSFEGISSAKNSITIKYRSNSDNRKFYITQKPTPWTSDSLLTNYVKAQGVLHQTSPVNGLAVYIYNGGNATWVDKGVWFNIVGENSLSADQLASIAGSF